MKEKWGMEHIYALEGTWSTHVALKASYILNGEPEPFFSLSWEVFKP